MSNLQKRRWVSVQRKRKGKVVMMKPIISKRLRKRVYNFQVKSRVKFYAIALKKSGKNKYSPDKTRVTRAVNFKEASKKLNVSPYAMREYGIIVSPRRAKALTGKPRWQKRMLKKKYMLIKGLI